MKIQPRPVGGSALVRDYLCGRPSALSFYSGPPFALESYRRKLADVSERFGRDERAGAARALTPTSDAASRRLQRFVDEGGAVVTTGQQTGFLSGPLFTIHKALSAVVLADHLEKHLGVTVLPVFWIASEDHDWAEVNHANLLGPRGRLRRFELPGAADPTPIPMSERQLDSDLDDLCDEVCHFVAGEANNAEFVRMILDAYRPPGRTVAEAFSEVMRHLLAPFDVLLADASDRALKEASRPILRRGLVEAEAQEEKLSARSIALEEKGYPSQVTILERGTNVFLHDEGGRARLYRRGVDFMRRERRGVLKREDLLERLESDPGRFSPNVLLRPVVESSVFPSLAYVGGPGEIGYFAQVGALFESYGMVAPVVVPRYSATLIEAGVARAVRKLGLEEGDFDESREVLKDRLARGEIPPAATASLEAIRGWLVEGYEKLMDAANGMDPSVVGSLGALRNRGLLDAWRAERKLVRSIKRSDLEAFRALDRVLDAVRPNNAPQDRVLNVLPFVARYGEGFLRELHGAIREQWRLPKEG